MAGLLYPVSTDIICFSLDSTSPGPPQQISGGYQEDTLEQSEKSKKAVNMATGADRKITY